MVYGDYTQRQAGWRTSSRSSASSIPPDGSCADLSDRAGLFNHGSSNGLSPRSMLSWALFVSAVAIAGAAVSRGPGR